MDLPRHVRDPYRHQENTGIAANCIGHNSGIVGHSGGRKVSVSQASFCTAAQTRDFIQKFLQLYTSLNSLLAISIHSLALSQSLVQEIDLSKNKNVSKGEVSDYLNSFRTSHSCISLYTNSIHYSTVKIFVARNNRLASRSRHPRHLSQWNWDVCYHQFS